MTDRWCGCRHHITKHEGQVGACSRCECPAFAPPHVVTANTDFEVALGDIAYDVALRKLDGSNKWYAQDEVPAAVCRLCHEQLFSSGAFGRRVWRHAGRCPAKSEVAYKVVTDE